MKALRHWASRRFRGRTIAIGDIHGCSRALAAILDVIKPRRRDTIVTLGDHIDRGPDSRGVIDRLIELSKQADLVPLLGNHEMMLFEALEHGKLSEMVWRECGGQATLDSYGAIEQIPKEHVQFLRGCYPSFETASTMFVHANYDPEAELEEQPEFLLMWEHLTNSTPKPHKSGKRVVVGHTPQASGEILNLDHVICIDTWCYGDGWLTALDVETGQYWQANKEGKMRPKDEANARKE